jgi:hypothetical protein
VLVGLNRTDVAFGRGPDANRHVGNKAFRDRVMEHAPTYHQLRDGQKMTAADAVIAVVHETGGGFYEKDASGNWAQVTLRRARLKTQNLLREYNSDLRERGRLLASSNLNNHVTRTPPPSPRPPPAGSTTVTRPPIAAVITPEPPVVRTLATWPGPAESMPQFPPLFFDEEEYGYAADGCSTTIRTVHDDSSTNHGAPGTVVHPAVPASPPSPSPPDSLLAHRHVASAGGKPDEEAPMDDDLQEPLPLSIWDVNNLLAAPACAEIMAALLRPKEEEEEEEDVVVAQHHYYPAAVPTAASPPPPPFLAPCPSPSIDELELFALYWLNYDLAEEQDFASLLRGATM